MSATALALVVVAAFSTPTGICWSSALGWGGIALIVAGVFLIAAYTVNDAYAVKFLLVSPILLDYFGNFVRLVFLTPTMLSARDTLHTEWRTHWRLALGVGALMPLSYILALYAM
jgi:hypothetical protein